MNWTIVATGLSVFVGVVVSLWYAGRSRRLEREARSRMEATVNFRQGTAQHLIAINAATQALTAAREPTRDELIAFLQARNLWCGTTGDMMEAITKLGYVVVTSERWDQIVRQLGPEGMSRQQWLDRED